MTINAYSGLPPYISNTVYPGMENKNIARTSSPASTNPDEIKKAGRRSSPEDCQTCKERKYPVFRI